MSGAEVSPRLGDVRVIGNKVAFRSRVEVWCGTEWVFLRGVRVVEWASSTKSDAMLATLRLEVVTDFVETYTAAEKVAVELVSLRAQEASA